jgi:DNA-binding NarL/FixJ family response regulator
VVAGRRSRWRADDNPPTRAGIRLALDGYGFEVVSEECDRRGAVGADLRDWPDVCLLDIHMPSSGIAGRSSTRTAGGIGRSAYRRRH